MAEQPKKVSIAVPVYNVEAYLGECLDSLVGQTYRNLEILLIDDGSTDGSGRICDAYAGQDSRVKVFHKRNEGVSAARNEGIRRASGDYLIFVDSDDRIHCQLVELYMAHLPEEGTLWCDFTLDASDLNQRYRPEAVQTETVSGNDFMQMFYRDYIHSPVNKLYTTKVLKERAICFPEGKSLGEDLLFNMEYFRYAPGDYHMIHAPLYYYRENRDGSLSSSYRKDLFEIQQELYEALKNFLKERGEWNEANAGIYYGIYWDRLFLAVRICRAYEKTHPGEHRLKEIVRSPLWQEIWRECKRRKLDNWKRRLKAMMLHMYRL